MTDERGSVPAHMRAVILVAFPDLTADALSPLGEGWHATAIDGDNRLVFKFPRHTAAAEALIREAALLAVARPALTMRVPDLRIHEGPPLFSSHAKIHGEHLLTADYDALTDTARARLAADLARFYAELHRIPLDRMEVAGARAILPWQSSAGMRAKALPLIPIGLQAIAADAISAYEHLPPDPLGMTYGFFDGHGWNMAFDHTAQRLKGIYDFADSGFGPRHQEFIYSNLISPDLTARIVTAYEASTDLTLDRRRIDILTGAHRLSELAELADDPTHAPDQAQHAAQWLSRTPRAG